MKEFTNIMKSLLTRSLALMLVLMMLCVAGVGCSSTADPNLLVSDPTTPPTLPANPAPRPTNVAQEVDDDCPFIGTWKVSAQALAANEMVFTKSGTVSMFTAFGQIGGTFTYTDTDLVITTDSKTLTGTYVIENGTITITTANDVITLSAPDATETTVA